LQQEHPYRRALLPFLLVAAAAAAAQGPIPKPITHLRPTVILISIDGFRSDYLEKYSAPNLQHLATTGVRAAAMQPCFPTYTFPNHYTIVTGLYPAHHGIVANEIYDPGFDATFVYKEPAAKEGRWWGGEPIWVTAEKRGQRTANLYWPGSAAPIEGMWPDYWEPFDEKVPPAARVDKILGWLDLPSKQRPTFLALYFDQVDHEGHQGGPDSPQVRNAIALVDAALARLLDGLRQRGIADRVNIVVVSDHGMASTSPERVIFLDPYTDLSRDRVPTRGSLLTVWPALGETETVLAKLRGIPHMQVYRREDLPARWHYSGNPRIAPIIALADEGWTVTTHEHFKSHDFSQGQHGYDNDLPSMQALFLAHGPAFKAGTQLPAFSNVDVYELLAYLLHLKPARNDGTLEVFRPVLVAKRSRRAVVIR
jgi:predicted AlkP superfamily pyrophosphatase or phosphodiesterase